MGLTSNDDAARVGEGARRLQENPSTGSGGELENAPPGCLSDDDEEMLVNCWNCGAEYDAAIRAFCPECGCGERTDRL